MSKKYGFFLLLLSLWTPAWAAHLDSLAVVKHSDYTVINCIITGHPSYHVFTLHRPERIVIDFEGTNTVLNVKQMSLVPSLIRQARIGHPNSQTLRVVLDITQPISTNQVKVSPSISSQQMHLRIQFPSKTSVVVVPRVSRSIKIASSPQVVRALHVPPRTLRNVVVVIDPGHGGHDPGAIGMRRTNEKHVVLAIALKLKRLIDQQPGMRAVLTRTGDYYVGLRDRMHIARRYNGDIFVAIHADAFGNHASHGASVFALSQRGATSEAARWLAEKENYSELGGVNLSELDDQNGAIRSVLIDLSQTATISASLQMGEQVLRHLNQMTTLHSHKVEQARFMVLKSPDIPSVLIETGFISNPGEEAKLNNPSYQTRLCQAIMGGIKAYFWDYPPHGSRIEALSGANNRLARE